MTGLKIRRSVPLDRWGYCITYCFPYFIFCPSVCVCAFRDFSLFVSIFSCSSASFSFSFHLGQNACFLLFCSISGHPKYSLLFQHFLSKKIPSAKLIWNGFLRVSNYEDTGSLRWIIDWLCPQGFHELDQAL